MDIAKKITFKLHQTNNNIAFMLFDEINHILSLINENQNRQRILFIKLVLQKISSMLDIECKHTTYI